MYISTVKPVYNSPVLSGQFSKSGFFAYTDAVLNCYLSWAATLHKPMFEVLCYCC